MPKLVQITQTINADTGEIMGVNKQTVYRTERLTEKGWRFKEGIPFRSFEVEGLSWADRGRLTTIAQRVDKVNRIPAIAELAECWELSERGTYHLLNRLLAVGAVGVLRIPNRLGYPAYAYYLNPAIAFAGKNVTPALWRMFRASMMPYIPRFAHKTLDRAAEGLPLETLPGEETV